MVRLVFRPYTQVRRSICTSESLRSSIRVSSDFDLLEHSSPSFGYQRVYALTPLLQDMNGTGWYCASMFPSKIIPRSSENNLHFHFASGLCRSLRLAYMLDSLVRVSRRSDRRPPYSPLTTTKPIRSHLNPLAVDSD